MTNFERRALKGIYYISSGFIVLTIITMILAFFFLPEHNYLHSIFNIILYTAIFLLSRSILKKEEGGELN